MSYERRNNEILFEVEKHIGILKEYDNGWKKELNIVSWNGTEGKYDIRDWDEDHIHMTRGITLKKDEMIKLIDLMVREEI